MEGPAVRPEPELRNEPKGAVASSSKSQNPKSERGRREKALRRCQSRIATRTNEG